MAAFELRLRDGGPPLRLHHSTDQKPEAKLAPSPGTMERYRLQEWLNFIATDLHRGMSPLFNPKLPEDMKQANLERLSNRFDFLTKRLSKEPYLMGSFTVADAYLFTILGWTKRFGLDLSRWSPLQAFQERVRARPAVQATLKAEGLS